MDKSTQILQEYQKCKQKILEETDCFDKDSSLFAMVCILISQRDNAYNEADFYKKKFEKYQSMI